MPQNKNALIRYQTIDECLRNTAKKWTKEMLLEKVLEVLYEKEKITKLSIRTIQLDIQHMRSNKLGYNAPIIVYERKYYKYEDPNFKFYDATLSKGEIKHLIDAMDVIKQFMPFKQFAKLSDDFTKLEKTITKDVDDNKGDIKYIQLDKTVISKGTEWITPIKNALANETCLRISYEPFKKEKYTITVSPQILKEYNNRWFLLCTDMNDKIQTMALDRIDELEEWIADTYRPYRLDLYTYFDNCIGVSKVIDSKPVRVVFKIKTDQFPYIFTKPLHSSQEEISRDEEWVTVSLDVVNNFELKQKLMTFLPKIKILEPKELREDIKKTLKEAYDLY